MTRPTPITTSWAVHCTGAAALHDMGLTGAGITVGHLDSGVQFDAREVATRVARSCVVSPDGTRVDEDAVLTDDLGHGTATASLIAGGRPGRTRVGIAPGAHLYSATVLEGGATVLRIIRGLEWAAEHHLRIVALPAGLPTFNPTMGPLLARLRQRGMLIVCPIGNTGAGTYRQPGDDPAVLSVGSFDRRFDIPDSCGSRNDPITGDAVAPDVLAPGVEVDVARRTGGIIRRTGTSYAAAVTAGVAALLLEAVPAATVDGVIAAITGAAAPAPSSRVRGGRLDATRALAALRRSPAARPAAPNRPRHSGAWRDPRLLKQLDSWPRSSSITALYVVNPGAPPQEWAPAIDRLLSRTSASRVDWVQRHPLASMMAVHARPAVHRSLIDDTDIHFVSAADSGRFISPPTPETGIDRMRRWTQLPRPAQEAP